MARDIAAWLASFRAAWLEKDVDAVLDLFTDDVDYYETPSQKLAGKEKIRQEWQAIHDQQDIALDTTVFSRDGNRYTVQWRLSYRKDEEARQLHGVYLLTLNDDNRCEEFWQYCQNA